MQGLVSVSRESRKVVGKEGGRGEGGREMGGEREREKEREVLLYIMHSDL